MARSLGLARCWIVPALAAACLAAALPACKREKPNANRDLQKNQHQLMNEMDEIAKKLEDEEKAKKAKEAVPAGETPPSAPPSGEKPPKNPAAPPEKKPDGGR